VKVDSILVTKGSDVVTVEPGAALTEALALFRQRDIGAVVVVEDGHLVGLLSERDVVRALDRASYRVLDMRVAQVMQRAPITCSPDDDIQHIMAIMTHERVRHLPVLVGPRLCGIVSAGDVIKARLDQAEAEIQILRDLYRASH
jgi:CBS domain-containing protein